MDEEVSIVKEVQGTLSAVILQMMNNETRKVCFSRCFDGKFGDSLTRNDQICLAKCMDRMYEAHTIVGKAVAEMAQSLNNELS
ncbi:TIM10 DDP zinc finger domain-containing protein [Cryptosporidium andersoni]|uniref:Mitochondrial import inner membrane translocase subunit n=1 Tax=Cryptosporidium andersoni TaxID=117008 RepID=A0A1J4MUD4_9CRYT|nr:TIM10 DDP zinc finger domain-containing protein [Cryptosporidium andersoni]